jgi:hypothetical protein
MLNGATISVGEYENVLTMILSHLRFSHLTIVRNAFAGVPTLYKEYIKPDEMRAAVATSDIL